MSDFVIEGGLYITGAKPPFGVLKVLKAEPGIVHVRVYENKYDELPGRIDPSSLVRGKGIGHLPLRQVTFDSWAPKFLQRALVSPDELEGYELWKEAEGSAW